MSSIMTDDIEYAKLLASTPESFAHDNDSWSDWEKRNADVLLLDVDLRAVNEETMYFKNKAAQAAEQMRASNAFPAVSPNPDPPYGALDCMCAQQIMREHTCASTEEIIVSTECEAKTTALKEELYIKDVELAELNHELTGIKAQLDASKDQNQMLSARVEQADIEMPNILELTSERDGVLAMLKSNAMEKCARKAEHEFVKRKLAFVEEEAKKMKVSFVTALNGAHAKAAVARGEARDAVNDLKADRAWREWKLAGKMEKYPEKSGQFIILRTAKDGSEAPELNKLKDKGVMYSTKIAPRAWVVKPGFTLKPFARWLPVPVESSTDGAASSSE